MALQNLFFIFILAFFISVVTAARNTRFHQFFPYHRVLLTDIRDHHCAASYMKQQAGEGVMQIGSRLCSDVLDCILEHTTESVKGNIASAAVALGLMPTILTFLGSSTSETALLSRRRPLLSFLIACGSPAVNPIRTFSYQDPLAELSAREGRLLPHFLSTLLPSQAVIIIFVEYVLVLGAISNVITTSYYLGLGTINTLSCTVKYLPVLWVVLTVFIHVFGTIAFALRVNIKPDARPKQRMKAKFLEQILYEFTPCVKHNKLDLQTKDESYLFVFISWATSIGTVVHILFGTIAFSSVTLLGKSVQ